MVSLTSVSTASRGDPLPAIWFTSVVMPARADPSIHAVSTTTAYGRGIPSFHLVHVRCDASRRGSPFASISMPAEEIPSFHYLHHFGTLLPSRVQKLRRCTRLLPSAASRSSSDVPIPSPVNRLLYLLFSAPQRGYIVKFTSLTNKNKTLLYVNLCPPSSPNNSCVAVHLISEIADVEVDYMGSRD